MTKDIAGRLTKFAQLTVKRTMIQMQSELSSTNVSPFQEGRFRSNWFATSSSPSDKVIDGEINSPQTDAEDLELDYNKKYYLSNNLPYANRLCYGDWAVSKPKNWYPTFINGRYPVIVQDAAKKAEKEAGL